MKWLTVGSGFEEVIGIVLASQYHFEGVATKAAVGQFQIERCR